MAHPLQGPRLKVRRAERQIVGLRRAEEVLGRDAEYEVVRAEHDPKTGQHVYRLRVGTAPPLDEWGVAIGEIAHNLRSALDGVVHQLALLTTNTPAGNTQWPIFLVGHTASRARYRHCFEGVRTKNGRIEIQTGDGRAMIRQLLPHHQARIEGLQPYKRGRGGRRNALYLLKEVNNADKHRLIQVVAAHRGVGPTVGYWGGAISGPIRVSRLKVLKDGAKVVTAPPEVHVNARIVPFVAFAEGCPVVIGRRVITVLSQAAKEVSAVLSLFSPEFP